MSGGAEAGEVALGQNTKKYFKNENILDATYHYVHS